jgi:SAM-dependent methyltransferase
MEAIVEHDPTLKWIISDQLEAIGPTPPPLEVSPQTLASQAPPSVEKKQLPPGPIAPPSRGTFPSQAERARTPPPEPIARERTPLKPLDGDSRVARAVVNDRTPPRPTSIGAQVAKTVVDDRTPPGPIMVGQAPKAAALTAAQATRHPTPPFVPRAGTPVPDPIASERTPPAPIAVAAPAPDFLASERTPPGPIAGAQGPKTPSPDEKTPPTSTPYQGATPVDFFTADPTPPPPEAQPEADGPGAAPSSIFPAAPSSDSEISADAVELLPSAADEIESAATAPTASAPPVPGPLEPREVDPEVLEEVEPSESPAAPNSQARGVPRLVTPPPVPEESVSSAVVRLPETPASVAPKALDAIATETQPKPPEQAASSESATSSVGTSPFDDAAPTEGHADQVRPADQVPEALARRSLKKRSKPWYEEVFDEDYLRTVPFMTPAQTAREVAFIREMLAPPAAGEVLDIGCGYGRHALDLAQQGFHVTGLDLSLPLLIRAADQAQKRGLGVDFVHADMREMSFNAQFDGAYCVLSSFGYFDEETNARVAGAICKALKPGGRFLLDILNRDYIVSDLPSRVWWEGDGCVVLEEVDFNYHTSRVLIRRSVVFGSGRQVEQELSLRAYSLHELGKLLRQAGLRVLDVSGGLATKSRFFGAASRNIIALCERPLP